MEIKQAIEILENGLRIAESEQQWIEAFRTLIEFAKENS